MKNCTAIAKGFKMGPRPAVAGRERDLSVVGGTKRGDLNERGANEKGTGDKVQKRRD